MDDEELCVKDMELCVGIWNPLLVVIRCHVGFISVSLLGIRDMCHILGSHFLWTLITCHSFSIVHIPNWISVYISIFL